ncbi:MAG TPA: LLM class flavin-dependent oxidoreductase [Ktedonobacteraceae bacterium]|nr:LLM class flavin-dependent oxidoreductase [Ktedonobacteraceae bacterium]
MHIGIALPTAVPGTSGHLLLEWVRKADSGPFSSLTVLDHTNSGSYEPFTVLAAAAALTQRVRLAIILPGGSLRTTLLLAKVTTSIDALSQGRLIVGLALGGHPQGYAALGIDPPSHGKLLTGQLSALRALWNERPLGPKLAHSGGPPLLLGGPGEQVAARIALAADGLVAGQDAQHFARAARQVRAAWAGTGRPGRPQLWAVGHFALGDDAAEGGRRYLRESFAFAGPSFAQEMVAQLLASPDAIMRCLHAFEEAGCDEFVFSPTVADLAQLDRLITVLQGRRQT